MTGIGSELKRAREAAHLAIDDVAHKLKLLPRQVESLEHERFDRLPGPAIARGMVRNYARLLELDPEPLVERMAPRAEERQPLPERKGRSALLYAGFAVALLALIGALMYERRQENAPPEIAAPVGTPPVQPAALIPIPPPAEPVETPLAQPAEKPPAAAQPSLSPDSRRLVLRMEEEAWLEVRDGAGRSLVASLNPAGTERVLRGEPPFQLVVGNASHVRLTYDGEPVDLKPHMRGEVARFTLPLFSATRRE